MTIRERLWRRLRHFLRSSLNKLKEINWESCFVHKLWRWGRIWWFSRRSVCKNQNYVEKSLQQRQEEMCCGVYVNKYRSQAESFWLKFIRHHKTKHGLSKDQLRSWPKDTTAYKDQCGVKKNTFPPKKTEIKLKSVPEKTPWFLKLQEMSNVCLHWLWDPVRNTNRTKYSRHSRAVSLILSISPQTRNRTPSLSVIILITECACLASVIKISQWTRLIVQAELRIWDSEEHAEIDNQYSLCIRLHFAHIKHEESPKGTAGY